MDKNKILAVIFCISLPLFLLILSYKITLHYSDLTPDQKNTIDFLKNNEELNLNYTANEISHLEDVKKVMNFIDYLFYFLILVITVILTYYKRNQEQVKTLLKYGGIVTITLIILILLASLISFNAAFTAFHELFFPQGNWIFPADSLLIQVFSLDFFIEISRNIFIHTIICGIVFILISLFWKK